MNCDIILRTCDRVYTVHGSSIENKTRVAGSDKFSVMMGCIRSLIDSMNLVERVPLRLIIVDDHSEKFEAIMSLSELCKHPVVSVPMGETSGNGASLKTCYDWALINGSDYLYFVEDDYLHAPHCLPEMFSDLDFIRIKLRNHEVGLFPYDNIDNYMQGEKNSIPSFITLGSKRHWRTVSNTTCTFMCSKDILQKYWYLFELATHYGEDGVTEDNTFNQIWSAPMKQAGGAWMLSPIPTLAHHLHFREHLAPFTNWEDWW